MNKGIDELIKLLIEIREFYDSIINPFAPIMFLHSKKSEGENKADAGTLKDESFKDECRPEVLRATSMRGSILRNMDHKEFFKEDGKENVRISVPWQDDSVVYISRIISFLLGNRVRGVLNALNDADLIDRQLYESLTGKLMEKTDKAYKALDLALSVYILNSRVNELGTYIAYNVLLKGLLGRGPNNE